VGEELDFFEIIAEIIFRMGIKLAKKLCGGLVEIDDFFCMVVEIVK